jgi:hypothetical protein
MEPSPRARGVLTLATRAHGLASRATGRAPPCSLLPSRSREKMRCADFHVFSLRVQGPQPLPPTAQVILPSCRRHGLASRANG